MGPKEIPKDLLSTSYTVLRRHLRPRIRASTETFFLTPLVFIVPRRPTSYAAKTTKEKKKSWGILAGGCLFSLARCKRSILWPRAKHTVEPYKHFIPVGALSFTMNGEQSPLMQKKKLRWRRSLKRRCEIRLRRDFFRHRRIFRVKTHDIPIVQ